MFDDPRAAFSRAARILLVRRPGLESRPVGHEWDNPCVEMTISGRSGSREREPVVEKKTFEAGQIMGQWAREASPLSRAQALLLPLHIGRGDA